jgi:hypothetical protein
LLASLEATGILGLQAGEDVKDHVWTTTELLSYRVPPHFLDTLPALERLYPPFEETHHGS